MSRSARRWCAIALPALLVTAAVAQTITPQMQALYERARGEQATAPEAAVADYRSLIHLAPKLAPAYNNLGRLLFNLGRLPEAVDVLRQGLAIDPEMHPAEALLGASLFQMGDSAAALQPLRSATQAMPKDRFVRLTLARALLAQHQPEAAASELRTLTEQDSRDQESWYLLGKVELDLSQASFAHVQQIDPNSLLAHELAGEIMESLNNTPGAITEYKKAISLAPADPSALSHLANIYWATGDWPEARSAYEAVLHVTPTECTAHWRLAKALNELASPEDTVIEQAQLAITECPRLAPAYLEQARALLRKNSPREAIAALKSSEAITPDEPSIQSLLARAYRAVGETAQANAASARFAELERAEHAAAEHRAAEVMNANH